MFIKTVQLLEHNKSQNHNMQNMQNRKSDIQDVNKNQRCICCLRLTSVYQYLQWCLACTWNILWICVLWGRFELIHTILDSGDSIWPLVLRGENTGECIFFPQERHWTQFIYHVLILSFIKSKTFSGIPESHTAANGCVTPPPWTTFAHCSAPPLPSCLCCAG